MEAFEALSDADQLAIVEFLKTLKMPVMADNPQPQEVGSPIATNPAVASQRRTTSLFP